MIEAALSVIGEMLSWMHSKPIRTHRYVLPVPQAKHGSRAPARDGHRQPPLVAARLLGNQNAVALGFRV